MVSEGETGIDRSEGSGSASESDEWIDRTGIVEEDGRGGNATGFDPDDGDAVHFYHTNAYEAVTDDDEDDEEECEEEDDEDDEGGVWELQNRWYRLSKLNKGHGAQDRRQQNRRADAVKDARTFCCVVELTDFQQDRVVHLLESMDSHQLGPHPVEMTILGLIVIVANEDGRGIQNEDLFINLLDNAGTSERKLRSLLETLQERV